MKRKHSHFIALIVTILIMSSCSSSFDAHILTPIPITQLKIGDYVQFGQYAGKAVLWRVIEDSTNPNADVGDAIVGDPLLFSDKIIANKAFDAEGTHNGTFSVRFNEGSNLWQTSNLRAWLNSSAEAGDVEWPCGYPPTEDHVTSNGYADEKGFLANGNFSERERSLIRLVTQKTLLDNNDRGLAVGGSEPYRYGAASILTDFSTGNYAKSYYHLVPDKVFLLGPEQVNRVSNRFGSYFRQPDNYWLRAPDASIYVDSSPAKVLYIHIPGGVMYRDASDGDIGVRPALSLIRELLFFESGTGSHRKPYVIARE